MTAGWVVVLTVTVVDGLIVYGPIEDEDTARDFAAFLCAEVDPASVHPLRSPTCELLAWRRSLAEAPS